MRNMASERARLYCVFLRVPRPTLVALAKQEVRVGDEAIDDDVEEPPQVCLA